MNQTVSFNAAMNTVVPKEAPLVPDGFGGRLRRLGFEERGKRTTSLMVHIEGMGPRRVYTNGHGHYWILCGKRRVQVELQAVLAKVREHGPV